MNFFDYVIPTYKENWHEMVKEISMYIEITPEEKITIKNKGLPTNLQRDDLIYFYCVLKSYEKGPKSLAPSSEECMIFSNIEARIPLKNYNQIYPTVIIELPHEYKMFLRNKYPNNKLPNSIITHWEKDKYTFLSSVFFGRKDPVIIMFISPSFKDHTIEESIIISHKAQERIDSDYQMSVDILRMAVNLNLYATNFGVNKGEYKNIKQHRFLERKKPDEARLDIEYFSLKQKIKIKREYYKKDPDSEGTHSSPKPHWRRGHYRHQHYGLQNQFKKLIFIEPVFVCAENFKGSLSDTEVTYEHHI